MDQEKEIQTNGDNAAAVGREHNLEIGKTSALGLGYAPVPPATWTIAPTEIPQIQDSQQSGQSKPRPSGIQPIISMSYNVNMELTDDAIFKAVSNRVHSMQEANEYARMHGINRQSNQKNALGTASSANRAMAILPSPSTPQALPLPSANSDNAGSMPKQQKNMYAKTPYFAYQYNGAQKSGSGRQNDGDPAIPSLKSSIKTLFGPSSIAHPNYGEPKTRQSKGRLWSPLMLDSIPRKVEFGDIESSFGRKIRFEHSVSHSMPKEFLEHQSNGATPFVSALVFSDHPKRPLLREMNEYRSSGYGIDTQALARIANQAKRHSHTGHRHLEVLVNLLMYAIHDEMGMLAKINQFVDVLSSEILNRHSPSQNEGSSKDDELGADGPCETEETLYVFVLDKLMQDAMNREETIEGLRGLRRSIVNLLRLNNVVFGRLKRFRTKSPLYYSRIIQPQYPIPIIRSTAIPENAHEPPMLTSSGSLNDASIDHMHVDHANGAQDALVDTSVHPANAALP
jgi:hypothetical protein